MAHTETVFVHLLDIGRRHANWAVARVVVNVNQVLDDIYPAHGAAVRQMWPYPGLEGSIESLIHFRLLFALTGKVLDTVGFHRGLEVRVEKFRALIGLKALIIAWVCGCEHLPESHCDCLGVVGMDRHHLCEHGKCINHGEKVACEFRRFAWQYPAYRPGRPATEHWSLPHRYGSM